MKRWREEGRLAMDLGPKKCHDGEFSILFCCFVFIPLLKSILGAKETINLELGNINR